MIYSKTSVLGGLLLATLLFSGCGDDSLSKSLVSVSDDSVKKEPSSIENNSMLKVELTEVDLSGVFKDSAKIEANEKYMVTIFESKTCKYCNQLRQDIDTNNELKSKLTDSYSSYVLDATSNKLHKLMHEGRFMDVDTNTLNDIYSITTTPTIVFSDKMAKSILVVPGYMPAKQFLVTLDFIEKGLWLDKDRKNGEVYEALKAYYIKEGIIQK